MKKKTTQTRKPHQIAKKNTSEQTLKQIICSEQKVDDIIKDLYQAFPKLQKFEKMENEHHFFFMSRTLDAVQQIKHQLNILKTITGIAEDEQ